MIGPREVTQHPHPRLSPARKGDSGLSVLQDLLTKSPSSSPWLSAFRGNHRTPFTCALFSFARTKKQLNKFSLFGTAHGRWAGFSCWHASWMHGIGWGLPRRAFAFRNHMLCTGGFPGSSDGKEPARNTGDPSSTPGPGRSAGEGPGNPLSTLAWRIPWTEEPGGLQSMGSQRVGRSWAANTHTHTLHWTYLFVVL